MIGSHTIPRFYLEQFANPAKRKGKSGSVWVYAKGKQPQPRSTSSQGYENGYFGFVEPTGKFNEKLETHLAELEGRCNDVLASSKSRLFDWCAAHRNTLAFYASLLFARATSRKKFSAGNWKKVAEPYAKLASNERYVRDTADHFTIERGIPTTPEEVRELILKQARQFSETENCQNAFVQDLLIVTEAIKPLLLSKPWQIWRSPSRVEFVASDNPLVTFLRLTDEVWHPGHGFRVPNVLAAFPLAPSACLIMGIAGPESKDVDEATVGRVNEIVIRCADRFIYSKTQSDQVAKMVNEAAGTSVPGQTAFVGEFPDEKRIEAYLRRNMGIRARVA